ncbi:flippase [Methanococcus maripaludis]|uniref:O-antigen/teichoic acid export membrane protein n=1 Tax=Methanococcus maripaludis TaxID=39152 RepID=A0A8T4GZV9_METMI|nr:flippase [Methanococcus maripaludis]MBM7409125.1 O-antigen/teichoic acid export membrane protein [Methanococcus maripaludis]MBP2218689.1 O-antigen/teichoic acid export membrane protein [Methanococcus maripaludis]
MSYKERMIKGASWNFLFLVLAAPVGYFVRILYANSLTKIEVGLFYAIFDLIGMIAIFRGLGLNNAIIYFIPKYLVQNRKDLIKSTLISVLIIQTLLAVLIAFLMYLFSPILINDYINSKGQFGDISVIFTVFIILIFGYYTFDGMKGVIFNSFQGFQSQKIFSTCNFLNISSILLLSIIFIHSGFGVYSPALAYTITPIVMILIYGTIFLKKIFPEFFTEKFSFSKKLLNDIFQYSMPIMFGSAGFIIMGYLDSMCLTYFTGLDAVADYRNVAMPTVMVLSYFASSIINVLLPMSTEMWEKGEKKNLSEGLKKILSYSFIISVPFAVILAYFPTVLINLFFNENYLSAALPMSILSFGIIFLSMNNIVFNVFNGIGKPEISTKILYIGAAFNLIFNLLLIPKFGTIGAAFTTTLSYVLIQVLQVRYLNKFLDYKFPVKKFVLCIVSSLISIIPLLVIKRMIFNDYLLILLSGIVYFIMYSLLIFVLKILNINELKSLKLW